MRLFSIRTSTLAAAAVLCLLTAATGCGDDVDATDNQNDDEADSLRCDAESWGCDEFVEGTELSVDRFDHDAVALNNEQVLLISGREYREDGGAGRTYTWEVYNVEDNEVEVEAEQFEQPRRDASVIQRDDGSVLLIGGLDDDGDRLESVVFFSADELQSDDPQWMDLDADMNAPYRQAVKLEDDRVVALGVSQGSDPARVVGQVFDPDGLDWSSLSPGDLLHDSVAEYDFEVLPDGRIFFAYAHRAPESEQPEFEDPPEDFDPPVLYERSAVAYDFENGEVEQLRQFDDQAFDYEFEVVELHNRDELFWNINTRDLDEQTLSTPPDEAIGLRFDPETEEFHDQYKRDLDPDKTPPGILQVLPGDEIIYDFGRPLQVHDVESGDWYDFRGFPDGLYYDSMALMPDCRLFVSGINQYDSDDEVDRVPTGQCVPSGE